MPSGKEKRPQRYNRRAEEVVPSDHLREDAINFVSSGGKNTLIVTKWLDAGRPSGLDSHHSHDVLSVRSLFIRTYPPFNANSF
jgi:hypothetical protein